MRPHAVVTRHAAVLLGVALLGAALLTMPAPAALAMTDGPPGDLSVEVFARIGSPGQPDGIYVTEDRVWVGTHNAGAGDRDVASRLFGFDHDGVLVDEIEIEGQIIEADNGILAIARDAAGVLYVADREPPRIVAVDPATGQQSTYATFRDLPTCDGEPDGSCSDARTDMADFTDAPLFAPDGTMYVTDLQQAVIWRVPPGGGEGEVWLTDQRFDSVFGINGMQLRPDGRTMLLSVTASTSAEPDAIAGLGYLYETVIGDDGEPGPLTTFWESRPADGPDGFAIAASGRVYVPLAGTNGVAVLSPDGVEVARVPSDPVSNQLQEVPFDTPVAVAFLGDDILVPNQSFFAGDPDHWAVFRIAAGEPGLPLYEPDLAAILADAAGAGGSTGTGGADGDGTSPTGAPAAGDRGLAATGGGAGFAALALAGLLARRRRR